MKGGGGNQDQDVQYDRTGAITSSILFLRVCNSDHILVDVVIFITTAAAHDISIRFNNQSTTSAAATSSRVALGLA
eukprot:CAMPEP_0178571460 /NCGR_PEP_ID=MMETSP0697-20121206/17644_1 /TAXON_ID=265572 /ORGANISM="Extubocellulus spinifer, Strain CCMP396" /LENGTH=75 /DNA_ID=CAMNT_0020206009 /DNA_START=220 /DNA_END=447 /DNA_ORIENTATION=+